MGLLVGGFSQALPNEVVTLSSENVIYNDLSAPWRANAALKIASDGKVYKYQGDAISGSETWSQIDAATDWVKPHTANDGNYEIQVQLALYDTPETFTINGVSKTVGTTWYALDGDVILRNTEGVQFGQFISQLTISIRYNGGATLDSGTYTLNASCDL